MSIVLIGYRGSGKTTVGRRLAERLWQSFVDVDDLIVQRAGRNIRDIFAESGEDGFRELESLALADALGRVDHVVALGGGALVREQNRVHFQSRQHKVVYLRCDPVELHRRITADPTTAVSRPSLTRLAGSVEEIRQLLAAREPVYRLLCTAELDVTSLSPDEAVVRIVRLL
jgi:shikimate kinase